MFQAIVGHEQYTKRVKEKSMPIGISDRRRTWHEAVETPCWKMLKYALQSRKGTICTA